MRILRFAFALFFLLLPATASGKERTLTIAAASDLSYALKEIAAGFEKDTGIRPVMSFGSTGLLARQIAEGAPFDVFLSADLRYMEKLKDLESVDRDTVEVYARGRIAVAVKEGADLPSIKDLAGPSVKKIAIANPAHAPYGRAAEEAMKSAGVWEAVRHKLVFGENIRQALQFVESGNAEAGIIALSIAGTPGISYAPIEESLHRPISQALGVVSSSTKKGEAARFIAYLKGPKGSAILKKYGFALP
ncbi:MAG: molybdate ABC transporter substrate-binding protein [Deltaproteobacteria bacterium GWB2_55_19]|nr:MAG: molybdate ABC transporter substrate-binding protein [Deltaproteobacteria bacterium GWB2_55_19]HAO94164.1 molybdate ABC transporter substrate-binding protein [Deltaproteobacteria bacterium]